MTAVTPLILPGLLDSWWKPKDEEFRTGFDRLETRMSGFETKVSGLDTKVSGLETRMSGLETRMSGLETKVSGLGTKVSGLETRVSGFEGFLLNMSAKRLIDRVLPVGRDNTPIPKGHPKNIITLWNLHRKSNWELLASLLEHYDISDWDTWGLEAEDFLEEIEANPQSSPPRHASLMDAISLHPERAVESLSRRLGVDFDRMKQTAEAWEGTQRRLLETQQLRKREQLPSEENPSRHKAYKTDKDVAIERLGVAERTREVWDSQRRRSRPLGKRVPSEEGPDIPKDRSPTRKLSSSSGRTRLVWGVPRNASKEEASSASKSPLTHGDTEEIVSDEPE